MLSNTQLTLIRTAGSAVITALAALYTFYPNEAWITIVIAVAGTIGIHVIPSLQQGITDTLTPVIPVKPVTTPVAVSSTPTEVTPVSDQTLEAAPIDGRALMGLAPVVQPVAAPEEPVAAETAPAPEEPVAAPVAPDNSAARQALTDAANALLKISETL